MHWLTRLFPELLPSPDTSLKGVATFVWTTTQHQIKYASHWIVIGSSLILFHMNFLQTVFNRTVLLKEDTGKL